MKDLSSAHDMTIRHFYAKRAFVDSILGMNYGKASVIYVRLMDCII